MSGFVLPDLLFWMLSGYLVGSVNLAVLLGKWKGKDIRRVGTGNPGASNVYRNVGRTFGAAILTLDSCKALIPMIMVSNWYGPTQLSDTGLRMAIVVAFAAQMGHCWPVFYKFRGGKGVAVSAGLFIGFGVVGGTEFGVNNHIYPIIGTAGYLAGLAVRKPGMAMGVMVLLSVPIGFILGVSGEILFGSFLTTGLFFARRGQDLVPLWGHVSNRWALAWSIVIEDIVPGQTLIGRRG